MPYLMELRGTQEILELSGSKDNQVSKAPFVWKNIFVSS